MTKMIVLSVVVVLGAASEASATSYSKRFCFDYQVDYIDADSNVGDDFWTDDTDKEGRGLYVRIERYGGPIVWQGWTPRSGSSVGCSAWRTLDDTYLYVITAESRARTVNNNIFEVYDDNTGYTGVYEDVHYHWPTSAGEVEYTTPLSEEWNVLAAAGYANKRRAGGLSNTTYRFFMQSYDPPNLGSGVCHDPFAGTHTGGCIEPNVSSNGADEKFLITHEMGHMMWRHANGGDGANTDYGADYIADGSSCDDETVLHNMNSYEYQSVAAYEGFAHYYAAAVWNDHNESNCRFTHYKDIDWNNDGNADYDDHDGGSENGDWYIDCENGYHDGAAWTVNADYFDDQCADGVEANRGTEFDWLRFLWDMTQDEDVNTGTIVDIMIGSNPDVDWNANDAGPSTNDPYPLLEDSAYAIDVNLGKAFASQASANGVDH